GEGAGIADRGLLIVYFWDAAVCTGTRSFLLSGLKTSKAVEDYQDSKTLSRLSGKCRRVRPKRCLTTAQQVLSGTAPNFWF
ncbi:MAG: hypothetical protein JWM16_5044, partial [Verrucomicrobiales bacterium]|nr:hypothetical protein [Verrucomicrobiales bacterium]